MVGLSKKKRLIRISKRLLVVLAVVVLDPFSMLGMAADAAYDPMMMQGMGEEDSREKGVLLLVVLVAVCVVCLLVKHRIKKKKLKEFGYE